MLKLFIFQTKIDFGKIKHLLTVLVKNTDVQRILMFGGEFRLNEIKVFLLVHLEHLKKYLHFPLLTTHMGLLGCSNPCGLPSLRMVSQTAADHHEKDPNLS